MTIKHSHITPFDMFIKMTICLYTNHEGDERFNDTAPVVLGFRTTVTPSKSLHFCTFSRHGSITVGKAYWGDVSRIFSQFDYCQVKEKTFDLIVRKYFHHPVLCRLVNIIVSPLYIQFFSPIILHCVQLVNHFYCMYLSEAFNWR